jgi:ABC-2 type transport system ATP-binding protein
LLDPAGASGYTGRVSELESQVETVLEVQGLIKRYGTLLAVDGVSLSVRAGEILGMIGPNGAGKTTTIECCNGLRKPDAGSVRVFGLEPAGARKQLYRSVGVQLQETSYPDKIRVREICRMIASFYEEPLDYRAQLDRFSLISKAGSRVSDLSGGQRQKLSIALALIADPCLLFLDELTTGLDPHARREMWENVRGLRAEGKTVFMTTHYMEEAEYLCDRVAIVNRGKLIALDTVAALIDRSRLDHIVSFDSTDLKARGLEEVEGVRRVEIDNGRVNVRTESQRILSRVVLYLEHQSVRYDNLRSRNPGLEDVFLELTGEQFAEDGLPAPSR